MADVEFLDSSRNSSKKDASRSKLHSSSIERGVGDHAINLSLLGPKRSRRHRQLDGADVMVTDDAKRLICEA